MVTGSAEFLVLVDDADLAKLENLDKPEPLLRAVKTQTQSIILKLYSDRLGDRISVRVDDFNRREGGGAGAELCERGVEGSTKSKKPKGFAGNDVCHCTVRTELGLIEGKRVDRTVGIVRIMGVVVDVNDDVVGVGMFFCNQQQIEDPSWSSS
jgi:hypothetical protein